MPADNKTPDQENWDERVKFNKQLGELIGYMSVVKDEITNTINSDGSMSEYSFNKLSHLVEMMDKKLNELK